jgi:hypothetical protein
MSDQFMQMMATGTAEERTALIQLEMMRMLNTQQQRGAGSSLGSGGDGDHDYNTNFVTRAFEAQEKQAKDRTERPRQVIHGFIDHSKARLGVRPGDPWSMNDLWELEDYTESRNLGRVAKCLAEAAEQGIRGNHEVCLATVIRTWQGIHQCSLDRGSWKVAEKIIGMTDPFAKQRWAGTPSQLSTAAGVLKAEADLAMRTSTWTPPSGQQVPPKAAAATGALGAANVDDGGVAPKWGGGKKGRKKVEP